MKQLTAPLYDLSGNSTGTVDLDASVFGVPNNPTLLHQALVHFLANRRSVIANTKDRGQVAGSGKKPWKQKGTGNARAGSTRSPLWRGGGVTFGPNTERNYSLRMPQKMRQGAFRVMLSDKVADESLFILTSLNGLNGKTKSWAKAVSLLPKSDSGMLVVTATYDETAERAIRNKAKHKYVTLESFTLYDAIRHPVLILTQDALEALTARLKKSTHEQHLIATKQSAKSEATV